MSKTINVDITESGDVTIDIVGGVDSSCSDIMNAFKKLGRVTKDVKKKEYYNQPNKNTIKQGK